MVTRGNPLDQATHASARAAEREAVTTSRKEAFAAAVRANAQQRVLTSEMFARASERAKAMRESTSQKVRDVKLLSKVMEGVSGSNDEAVQHKVMFCFLPYLSGTHLCRSLGADPYPTTISPQYI